MRSLTGTLRGALLILVVAAALPVFVVSTFSYRNERDSALEHYRHVAISDTQDLAGGYENMVEATHQMLAAVGRLMSGSHAAADCDHLLRELAPAYPFLTNIGVAHRDGSVWCTAARGATNNVATTVAFGRALQTGEFTIGDYEIGPWSKRRVFALFQPTIDAVGNGDVVFAGFELAWAQHLNRTIGEQPSEILVVDHDGRVADALPSDGLLGQDVHRDPLFARAVREQAGAVTTSAFGQSQRLWAFARWGGAGANHKYLMVAYPPEAAVLPAIRRALVWHVAVLGTLTIALLTAIVLLGRVFLLKPIDELVEATGRIASGDLKARIETSQPGELGRLAAAINGMSEALARRGHERDDAEAEAVRLAQIVLSSQEAIIGGTIAGTITAWNRGAERTFGYSAAQAIGQSVKTLICPDDRKDEYDRIIATVAAGAPIEQAETERVTRDGRRIDVSLSVSPLRGATGHVNGWSAIIRDVTSLKKAEAALRESEHRLTQILNAIPVAVYVIGLDGRLKFINDSARILLELDPAHAGTIDVFTRVNVVRAGTDTAYPHSQRPTVRALAGEACHVTDMELVRGNRRIPLEAWSAPVLDTSGAVAFGVVVYHDVTEQRALEAQYRHSQKMEAIGRLAGGIAHDFNNLLTVIVGHTDLLLESASQSDRGDLEAVKQAADRASSLTRQLLAFSRRQVLQPRTIDLNEQVTALLKILPRMLGENIVVERRLDAALPLVNIDPGQFDQVVMNLAVNARDAMPDGGRLTVETAAVELTDGRTDGPDLPPGRYVRFTLSDTGIGIDAETRQHMFEPFFTTKERGKGTGLGLATVYGIVRQSGGNIAVDSALGEGASFSVYLPASVPTATTADGLTTPSIAGSETILLVEDDAAVRVLASRALTRSGYNVLVADGPAAALDHLQRSAGRIHLMLTDVVLKSLDGHRLASIVADQHPDLPVLYMSGYTDNPVVNRGIVERRLPFLQKPFTPDQLARAVRGAIDRGPLSVA